MAALCDRHSLVCQTDNVCMLHRWGENRPLGPVAFRPNPKRIVVESWGWYVDYPLDVATEILLTLDRAVSRAETGKPIDSEVPAAPACHHAFACQVSGMPCFYKVPLRAGGWGVECVRNDRWPDAPILAAFARFHHWLSIDQAVEFAAGLMLAIEAARAAQAVAP